MICANLGLLPCNSCVLRTLALIVGSVLSGTLPRLGPGRRGPWSLAAGYTICIHIGEQFIDDSISLCLAG